MDHWDVIRKLLRLTEPLWPRTNIYDHEWDVLIILDACRFDVFQEARGHDRFDAQLGSVFSNGSMTAEWMRNTFTKEHSDEMGETVYVCANPYSDSELESGWFAGLDEVWRYGWDEDSGTVLPGVVTDRAITHARDRDPQKLLVHYIQPHVPFLSLNDRSRPSAKEFTTNQDDEWLRVRDEVLDKDVAWRGYRENLDLVLESVDLLLMNVDAETCIVSSDHGNCVGELGVYSHPEGLPMRVLRRVPWVETTAVDQGTHEPDMYDTEAVGDRDERLAALGYK